MATDIKRHMVSFHPVKYGGKSSIGTIRDFPESASQTYEYGAPLVWDTSNEAIKLATDTTVASIGLALAPASGTTGQLAPVLIWDESTVLRAPVLTAGATAAYSDAYTGVKYSWVVRTDGYGYGIDLADSGSNDWFQVIDVDGEDDDDPGYVFVRPIAAVLATAIVA